MTTQGGVAVVTGAAGGMGRPSAHRLAKAGHPLLLVDVAEGPIAALAEELRGKGAKVEILAGDIAAADFPSRIAAALGERPLRAMVHTAGLSPTMGGAERVLEVNLGASVRLLDALIEKAEAGTAVVMIASTAGHMGAVSDVDPVLKTSAPAGWVDLLRPLAPTPEVAYSLSKRGVLRLVKHAAPAWGRKGARIVSISPGIIDTGMGRAELAVQPMMTTMIETTPLARMGSGDEIAAVAAFLCSDDASFVSGCDVLVDGGSMAVITP